MPLHITKIAFDCESVAELARWLADSGGEARLTTRYCPRRVAEMEGGSLYWIHGHMIVGRSPIIGFADNNAGRYWIRVQPRLVLVQPCPKRAHQGWRYLKDEDAPPDLAGSLTSAEAMPVDMARELGRLGFM